MESSSEAPYSYNAFPYPRNGSPETLSSNLGMVLKVIKPALVVLQLNRIGWRMESTYRATFQFSPELISAVAGRCTEVDTWARNIDHILSHSLLPQMSEQFLARMAEGHPITSVRVSMSPKGEFEYCIE